MKLSSEAYLKTYNFPLWSFSNLIKWTVLVLVIAIPFFLSYSTPGMYVSIKVFISILNIQYRSNLK